MHSLGAPRQTGSHAPFCHMASHQRTTSTPIFSDPPLHHRRRWRSKEERNSGSKRKREGMEMMERKKMPLDPSWKHIKYHVDYLSSNLMRLIDGHSKFLLNWKTVTGTHQMHFEAAPTGSPGKPVVWGCRRLIFMSLYTSAHINQSQLPFL